MLLDDDNGDVIAGTVRTRKRAGHDLHRAIIGPDGSICTDRPPDRGPAQCIVGASVRHFAPQRGHEAPALLFRDDCLI